MKEDELLREQAAAGAWNLFCRTGLPEAYLAYLDQKNSGRP